VDPEKVEASAARCRALDLEPVVFPHVLRRRRYLAGSDEERLSDLQAAFDDPSIGAVWAIRGGYGTGRIIDRLSLDRQLEDPIPFIGFSDNTTLHVRHAAVGTVSFHGPHPSETLTPEADAWFRRVLGRVDPAGPLPAPRADEVRGLVGGVAEGRLVGGNLSILASLCGTGSAWAGEGAIAFLEDVGEQAYRVDRMLLQLERSGSLAGIAGLAFGSFGEDGRDSAVEDVLIEYGERARVPTVAGLSFGHIPGNLVLPVGVRARLDADAGGLTLLEPAVRAA
jgi:muramoyltetrapeptide carboxypeptidase